MEFICIGCGRQPHEIPEYVICAEQEGMTPHAFVLAEEGTLNITNGHFACTDCYIRMGEPASVYGWKAP